MESAVGSASGKLPQSKGLTFGTAVSALVIGSISIFSAMCFFARRKREATNGDTQTEEETSVQATDGVEHNEIPSQCIPEGRIFTEKTLAPFDGQQLPLCLGICGKVVNCSTSGNIKYGEGYGALWAGKDATWAMATLSLSADDANKRDFKVSELTDDQKAALAGWYKHFTSKYEVIGTMKEYDGWDFSEIHRMADELAKQELEGDAGMVSGQAQAAPPVAAAAAVQSPAAKAAPIVSAAAKARAAAAAAAVAAPSVDATAFKKGDRVQLRGLRAAPEVNNQFGIIEGFNDKIRSFEIKLESNGKKLLLKPANLSLA